MNNSLIYFYRIVSILFVVALTAFWIWQLIKCSSQEPPGNRKILWLILIALTHWIGATIYFFYKLIRKNNTF
ncbi:MAG TPA: hypothetical protein GXX25_11970 [Desulfotomaculum sp.]|nr:hypothetical protein [Desulfotomaculum sp.]